MFTLFIENVNNNHVAKMYDKKENSLVISPLFIVFENGKGSS